MYALKADRFASLVQQLAWVSGQYSGQYLLIRLISRRNSNLSLINIHFWAVKATNYSTRQAGMSIDELDVPCRPKVAL
jgi:hypothetical protein